MLTDDFRDFLFERPNGVLFAMRKCGLGGPCALIQNSVLVINDLFLIDELIFIELIGQRFHYIILSMSFLKDKLVGKGGLIRQSIGPFLF